MRCELCGRAAATTRHHLVPRSRRKREAEIYGPTADLCRDCHGMIHTVFDNRRLARERASIDLLRAAPELQNYLAWIRRRPSATHYRAR